MRGSNEPQTFIPIFRGAYLATSEAPHVQVRMRTLVRSSMTPPAPREPGGEVMNVKELCEYLGIHSATCYRLLKKGALPSFRVGSDHRFRRDAIDAWMESRRIDKPIMRA
jgi:excisionase family DNA binding protein